MLSILFSSHESSQTSEKEKEEEEESMSHTVAVI
jgi:hypothetical protein